jgi:hypothetical protein
LAPKTAFPALSTAEQMCQGKPPFTPSQTAARAALSADFGLGGGGIRVFASGRT